MDGVRDKIVKAFDEGDFFVDGAATKDTKFEQIKGATVTSEGNQIKIKMGAAGGEAKPLGNNEISDLKDALLENCQNGDAKNALQTILNGGDYQKKAQILEAFMKYGPQVLGTENGKEKLARFLNNAADQPPDNFANFLKKKAEELKQKGAVAFAVDLAANQPPGAPEKVEDPGGAVGIRKGSSAPTYEGREVDIDKLTNTENAVGIRTRSSAPTYEGSEVDINKLTKKDIQEVLETLANTPPPPGPEDIRKEVYDAAAKRFPNGPKEAIEHAVKVYFAQTKSSLDSKNCDKAEIVQYLKSNRAKHIQNAITTSTISKDNIIQAYCCPPDQDPALKKYELPDKIKNNANALSGVGYLNMVLQRNNPDINPAMMKEINEILATYEKEGIEIPHDPLDFMTEILAKFRAKNKKLFDEIDLPKNLLIPCANDAPLEEAIEIKTYCVKETKIVNIQTSSEDLLALTKTNLEKLTELALSKKPLTPKQKEELTTAYSNAKRALDEFKSRNDVNPGQFDLEQFTTLQNSLTAFETNQVFIDNKSQLEGRVVTNKKADEAAVEKPPPPPISPDIFEYFADDKLGEKPTDELLAHTADALKLAETAVKNAKIDPNAVHAPNIRMAYAGAQKAIEILEKKADLTPEQKAQLDAAKKVVEEIGKQITPLSLTKPSNDLFKTDNPEGKEANALLDQACQALGCGSAACGRARAGGNKPSDVPNVTKARDAAKIIIAELEKKENLSSEQKAQLEAAKAALLDLEYAIDPSNEKLPQMSSGKLLLDVEAKLQRYNAFMALPPEKRASAPPSQINEMNLIHNNIQSALGELMKRSSLHKLNPEQQAMLVNGLDNFKKIKHTIVNERLASVETKMGQLTKLTQSLSKPPTPEQKLQLETAYSGIKTQLKDLREKEVRNRGLPYKFEDQQKGKLEAHEKALAAFEQNHIVPSRLEDLKGAIKSEAGISSEKINAIFKDLSPNGIQKFLENKIGDTTALDALFTACKDDPAKNALKEILTSALTQAANAGAAETLKALLTAYKGNENTRKILQENLQDILKNAATAGNAETLKALVTVCKDQEGLRVALKDALPGVLTQAATAGNAATVAALITACKDNKELMGALKDALPGVLTQAATAENAGSVAALITACKDNKELRGTLKGVLPGILTQATTAGKGAVFKAVIDTLKMDHSDLLKEILKQKDGDGSIPLHAGMLISPEVAKALIDVFKGDKDTLKAALTHALNEVKNSGNAEKFSTLVAACKDNDAIKPILQGALTGILKQAAIDKNDDAIRTLTGFQAEESLKPVLQGALADVFKQVAADKNDDAIKALTNALKGEANKAIMEGALTDALTQAATDENAKALTALIPACKDEEELKPILQGALTGALKQVANSGNAKALTVLFAACKDDNDLMNALAGALPDALKEAAKAGNAGSVAALITACKGQDGLMGALKDALPDALNEAAKAGKDDACKALVTACKGDTKLMGALRGALPDALKEAAKAKQNKAFSVLFAACEDKKDLLGVLETILPNALMAAIIRSDNAAEDIRALVNICKENEKLREHLKNALPGVLIAAARPGKPDVFTAVIDTLKVDYPNLLKNVLKQKEDDNYAAALQAGILTGDANLTNALIDIFKGDNDTLKVVLPNALKEAAKAGNTNAITALVAACNEHNELVENLKTTLSDVLNYAIDTGNVDAITALVAACNEHNELVENLKTTLSDVLNHAIDTGNVDTIRALVNACKDNAELEPALRTALPVALQQAILRDTKLNAANTTLKALVAACNGNDALITILKTELTNILKDIAIDENSAKVIPIIIDILKGDDTKAILQNALANALKETITAGKNDDIKALINALKGDDTREFLEAAMADTLKSAAIPAAAAAAAAPAAALTALVNACNNAELNPILQNALIKMLRDEDADIAAFTAIFNALKTDHQDFLQAALPGVLNHAIDTGNADTITALVTAYQTDDALKPALKTALNGVLQQAAADGKADVFVAVINAIKGSPDGQELLKDILNRKNGESTPLIQAAHNRNAELLNTIIDILKEDHELLKAVLSGPEGDEFKALKTLTDNVVYDNLVIAIGNVINAAAAAAAAAVEVLKAAINKLVPVAPDLAPPPPENSDD
ncbi:MAG: hypothetical protein LBF34_04130 [Puniceicoccales bacterium]|nr:hypothetical protein [Puniceicoccales bacterium]